MKARQKERVTRRLACNLLGDQNHGGDGRHLRAWRRFRGLRDAHSLTVPLVAPRDARTVPKPRRRGEAVLHRYAES